MTASEFSGIPRLVSGGPSGELNATQSLGRKLRWGIIGTGDIAHIMARHMCGGGIDLVAVGSRAASTASRFAAEFEIRHAHDSYQALLENSDVDAVYVATPHPTHVAIALAAARAGKHVLVEKPIAMSAAQAELMFATAAECGVVVLEAMWTRYLPHMIALRKLLAAGAIGTVTTLIADHAQALPNMLAGRWHNPALGGGALLDLGVYLVSFAHDLLGTPSTVTAQSIATASGVDARTAITLTFPGGAVAQLYTALDVRGSNRAMILGTAGRIEIDSVWFAPTGFVQYDLRDNIVGRYEPVPESFGMRHEVAYLELFAAGDVGVPGTSRNTQASASTDAADGLITVPPPDTVDVMTTMDAIRAQIGLRYPAQFSSGAAAEPAATLAASQE